jgi:hypothetical protein
MFYGFRCKRGAFTAALVGGGVIATGSQKKWGGFETRVCAVCGLRITLARHHAMHSFIGPFSLCGQHIGAYGQLVQTHKEAA